MLNLESSGVSVKSDVESVPLLDLKAQYATIRDEVLAAMGRVADSQYFILGPEVEQFEREIADYSQCRFGVGVTSGSDALLIALMAIDLKPGDEVITTPYTFFATAGAIVRLGARPVFVDIEPATYNLDPQKIEEAITEKSRAIIPVHLYGQMADMDPIMEIAVRRQLVVIEDAAQAIGAEYKGRRAGSIGHFGCFSFFPSKNLGGFGDGGLVTTNDPAHADQLKLLRNHGYRPKYYNKVVGGNFRLDALQAAILSVKLKYLDQWTEGRQKNAARYRELFSSLGLSGQTAERGSPGTGMSLPVVPPLDAGTGRHIYNQFVIQVPRRDELMNFLKTKQIGTEIYYPVPMHLQECFLSLGYKAGDFPASESAAKETLALPIYPELTDRQLRSVVTAIAEFYQGEH